MAEEHEVEEGEIYDHPDIDIDEKVQSLLGDFIKEFEDVSFENLGPKFGVYGTFLPTYQRLPSILCQPTTPPKSVTSRVDDSRFCEQVRSLNETTESVEVLSKFRETPTDSPTTILHTMTCFPVALLSPLHDKLLTLSTNKKLVPKNDEKAVKRVTSHKPNQSFEGKKKLTERQPSEREPPVSPFIIEGDWIRCDKCRKWRLLPYGTKPEQLSESWLCSMLDWLPGMNRCDISEEDTTRALHDLYRILILNNLQNSVGKGSIDGIGREVSVKKRKLREQDYLMTLQCNDNDGGDSDSNAFEREVSGGFRKLKKSKVFQTEKRESSTSKGEGKSRTRGEVTRIIPGIKDSPPIDRSTVEREHQTKKYRVKCQSKEEFGMICKQVCTFPLKKALGYGKEARTCIAIW